MRSLTPVYWTITGLMAAFMLMASIPDLLRAPQALAIFGHLGYPQYLLPFLGAAKSAGVAAALFPVGVRLKEWAFAGLTIDLVGALYSHMSVGDPVSRWLPAVIGLVLVASAYLLFRQRVAVAQPLAPAHAERRTTTHS